MNKVWISVYICTTNCQDRGVIMQSYFCAVQLFLISPKALFSILIKPLMPNHLVPCIQPALNQSCFILKSQVEMRKYIPNIFVTRGCTSLSLIYHTAKIISTTCIKFLELKVTLKKSNKII